MSTTLKKHKHAGVSGIRLFDPKSMGTRNLGLGGEG